MNKQLTIFDYEGTPRNITIRNFERVSKVVCEVITGDEVLTVYYNDGSFVTFDSCINDRSLDFHDGQVEIPLEHIDDISSIPDSYDMLSHYDDYIL